MKAIRYTNAITICTLLLLFGANVTAQETLAPPQRLSYHGYLAESGMPVNRMDGVTIQMIERKPAHI